MNIKTEQQTVVPYFMVGNARQFIDFAKAVFNAEVVSVQKREGSEDVIHAEITIGSTRVFLADSGFCGGGWISQGRTDGACRPTEGGKPIQMFVYVDSVDQTCRKALAAGGSVVMEPYDDDGGRMGAIADPFENLWWLKLLRG